MKIAAGLRLLSWAAWLALAAAQGAAPSSDQLPVPKGWHVVEFTKGAESLPNSGGITSLAKPVLAATQAPVSDSSENVDGFQIPSGYRIEGLTPAVDSLPVMSLPKVSLPDSSQPSATASIQQASALVSPDHLATSETVDGLQIPPGYRIEGFTPGVGTHAAAALATAPPLVEPLAFAFAPPTPTSAVEPVALQAVRSQPAVASGVVSKRPAQDLKVNGLDVPAGWAITSIIGEDSMAASDSSPPLTPKAAVVKVAQMPAVAAAAVSFKTEHKPVVTAPATSVPVKASEPTVSHRRPLPSAAAGSGPLATESKLTPIAAMAATPTAEAAVDNVVNYVTGQQEESAAPFVAPETLQHITSVECLTETIDNEGRPCSGKHQKLLPVASAVSHSVPAQFLARFASGAHQLMQQMGLYGAEIEVKPMLANTELSGPVDPQLAPLASSTKEHSHLRKPHEDHVTRVIEAEDTPASLQIEEVETHDEKADETQKSMAGLVSSR